MHCMPMSHKVITHANCFIPITQAQYNETEILKNEIKYMFNETIQPPETNGTMFLLGAEFTRGRVC